MREETSFENSLAMAIVSSLVFLRLAFFLFVPNLGTLFGGSHGP